MDRFTEFAKKSLQWIVISCDELWKYLPTARTTIFVGSWFTWMFAIISISNCHFMSIGDGMYVGLFSRPFIDDNGTNLGCVRYGPTDDDFDSMFAAGRAFGVISLISITFSLMLITTIFCCSVPERQILWSLARYSFAFGTIAQMFVFLILGSDRCDELGCSLSRSGVLAVFNTVFLASLSIVLFIENAPVSPWLGWSDYYSIQEPDNNDIVASMDASNSAIVNLSLQRRWNRLRIPPMEAIPEVDSVDHDNDISVDMHNNDITTTDSIDLDELQSLRWFRFATIGLVTFSWSMIIAGIQRCELILLTQSGGSAEIYAGLGLFSQTVEAQGVILGCVSYPVHTIDKFDPAFRAGRCFGTISALLMTSVLLLNIYQLFICNTGSKIWLTLKILLPCTFVSQLLSFTAFATDACRQTHVAECHVGRTGVVAILNVLMLLMLSILFYYIPSPKNPILQVSPELKGYFSTFVANTYELWTKQTKKRTETIVKGRDDGSIEDSPENHFYHGTDNHQIQSSAVESMSVQVVFTDREKKTIKTLYHSDGSQTITTTVEELFEEDDTDSCSEGDCSSETR